MKVTFPGMGDAAVILRLLFISAGIDIVMPASNDDAQESEAFREAPEDMCLPFKLFMAQLDRAWKEGADTVIFPTSPGPCRMGEFCEILRVLLKKRGCDFKWIILGDDDGKNAGKNSLFSVGTLPRNYINIFHGKAGPTRIAALTMKAHSLLKELENFEHDIHMNAGYYKDPHQGSVMINECRSALLAADSMQEAAAIMGHFRWRASRIESDLNKRPVKLLLTGEIFSQNEPCANMHIEDKLNDMGVCFEKDMTLQRLLRLSLSGKRRTKTTKQGIFGMQSFYEIFDKKYLPYNIGGYAKRTAAGAAASHDLGFDGVIHVMPAGCMPEIVGRAALDRISEEKGISCLTLVFDEISGEAGYITRIEAFTDMLERKKSNVLSWS